MAPALTQTPACARPPRPTSCCYTPEPTSASSARSWRSAQGCRARVRVDKLFGTPFCEVCTRRGKLAPAHHVVPVTVGGPALPQAQRAREPVRQVRRQRITVGFLFFRLETLISPAASSSFSARHL